MAAASESGGGGARGCRHKLRSAPFALGLTALCVWALGCAAVFGWLPPWLLPLSIAGACIAVPGILLAQSWTATTKAAAGAAAIALLVGTLNGRSMPGLDTQPASEEPWTLLRHGTPLLDDAPILSEWPHVHWIYQRADGHRGSWYPPGMALLALPIYLPTALAAKPTSQLLTQFEKSAASLLSALSVLLLGFALARAGSGPRWIFSGGLLYGLCSSALSLLSQALWPQTGSALAMGLILFAATEPEQRSSSVSAMLAGFILLTVRAPDALMLAPFLLAARSRRMLAWTLAGCLLGGLVFLSYNRFLFGSFWANGYAIGQRQLGFTLGEIPESTVGLLFGYSHGLLIYLPWLFVLPAALIWRERPVRAAMGSALILLCVMSFWWCWWGAGLFGPRMFAEAQLPLTFALVRGAPTLSPRGKKALLVLALLTFATHAAFLFWLSKDPTYSCEGPWNLAAHPLGHWLHASP